MYINIRIYMHEHVFTYEYIHLGIISERDYLTKVALLGKSSKVYNKNVYMYTYI
jgi:hypothetical protein